MTDDRIREIIYGQPIPRKAMDEVLKLLYGLTYIVDKHVNPSDELQQEAIDYANNIISSAFNSSVTRYKEEHRHDIETQDIFDNMFNVEKGE